jgi:hypothetical protein
MHPGGVDEGFGSPEDAVMAGWLAYPQAEARVVSVEYRDEDHAVVVTDTVPSHPMWNYCERREGGWISTGGRNWRT